PCLKKRAIVPKTLTKCGKSCAPGMKTRVSRHPASIQRESHNLLLKTVGWILTTQAVPLSICTWNAHVPFEAAGERCDDQ
ncbi:MAG: hypothetical protein PVH09_07315, partial [Chromatiales bacterium]